MTRITSFIAAVLLLLIAAAPASAQVVLNPGTISGSLSVTGETVDQFSVSAYWTDPVTGTSYNASTNVIGSSSYSLTVNVPSGTTPNYVVYAYAYINGYRQYLYMGQDVVVAVEASTVTADFLLHPGVITGTVTATIGTLSGGTIYSSAGSQYVSFGADGHYRLVVQPGNGLSVYGTASNSYGSSSLPSQPVGDVASGDLIENIDWSTTLPDQPPAGSIEGTLAVNGPVSPTQLVVYASGPSFGYISPSSNGPYSIPSLYAGSYYMFGYAYFGNSYVQLPDSSFSSGRYATVNGGAATTVDVTSDESFITGTVTLTGTKTLADVTSASLSANGMYGTNAYGGYAGTSLTPPSGAYTMVVPSGGWTTGALYLMLSSAAPDYLNESLNIYDYQVGSTPIALAAGESVTRNLTYATGTVSINFTALGGVLFSNPYVSGNCTHADAMGNPLWMYSFSAYSNNLSNVSSGAVTFAGLDGTCQLSAYAYVNGGYVTFGYLTVEVVHGTTQVIDIGGPSLAVAFPTPGYLTSATSLVVTGTATDVATGIASVVVNGVTADLVPAGNPFDMNEVSFSATIPLVKGPNTVATVATGNADDMGTVKTASDSRVVYSDSAAPDIVWIPGEGLHTAAATVAIDGHATDDAGIQGITLNGSPIAFTPTGNANNEVAFAVPAYPLNLGDNFITIVATDISGKTTTQTHKVVYSNADTTPPVFSVADITVNATTPAGAVVSFTLTATDDVDVTVPVLCSPASGSPFVIGTTLVNCTATDSSSNQTAHSFHVTVLDVAPVAVADARSGSWNVALTGSSVLANDTDGNGDSLIAQLVSGPSHGALTLSATGGFSYMPAANFSGADSFTYRASDGSLVSNIATVSLTITTPCPGGNCQAGTPIAKSDAYTVNHDATLTVAAKGVLLNDSYGSVAAVRLAGPSHGTLTLNANGGFVYTPAAGFSGTDTFTYAAKNAAGVVGPSAVVTIKVKPNLAPDADNDYYSTGKNTTLTVGSGSGVLSDDSDANGDALTALVVSGPSHGTLTLNANGSFVYKPAHNFTGTDTFTYKAKDPGGLTDTATVTVRVGGSSHDDHDDDHDGSHHHDGDHCDHETHHGGHYDGDGCEHDRRHH